MLAELSLWDSIIVAAVAAVLGAMSGLWVARRDRQSEDIRAARRNDLDDRSVRRRMRVDIEIADRQFKVATYERTVRYIMDLRKQIAMEAAHYTHGTEMPTRTRDLTEPGAVSALMQLHGGDMPRQLFTRFEDLAQNFDIQVVQVIAAESGLAGATPGEIDATRRDLEVAAETIRESVDNLITQMRGDLTWQQTLLANPNFAT